MKEEKKQIAVIGGGIVGCATAMALSQSTQARIVVLEAENRLAAHQTGNNSGVIHSGLYYKPGSLKAQNCVKGRELLYRFCEQHAVPYERCGKIVIATHESELPRLNDLAGRGKANGLEGLRELDPNGIKKLEPHACGIKGLHVPQTGIVNYVAVTEKYAEIIRNSGGEIKLSSRVTACRKSKNLFEIQTASGDMHCDYLINCAGLYSDHVAQMCGVNPGIRIIPFRGEYYVMKPEHRGLVKNLIYPVPDPQFPFLGVHFTRMIDGEVEMGPNAVLAMKREGYTKTSISIGDMTEYALFPGFWRMAFKFWKMGFGEMVRSFSKSAMVIALKRLMPELESDYIVPGGAGVRAQALDPSGKLLDDFRIVESDNMIHVLNAPSPAATASISIGQTIAEMALQRFDLR